MKKITSLKIAGAVLASALSALVARADLDINENVSIYGYAVGSASYTKVTNQSSDISMDIDAAKIGMNLSFDPLSAAVSIYTDKGAHKLNLLECNATLDLKHGYSIQGGRFVTWFGYEAFDIPDNTFVTSAEASLFSGIVPNINDGIRFIYKNGNHQFGIAVLDSIYGLDDHPYQGDGSMSDGLGFEANYSYTRTDWKLGATLGYQYNNAGHRIVDGEDPYAGSPKYFVGDIWSEWKVQDLTIGMEFFCKRIQYQNNFADSQNTYYAQLLVKEQITDAYYACSIAGRLSYGYTQNYGNFWKLSVNPITCAIGKNLEIRTELSYTRYSKEIRDSNGTNGELFGGVQAIFKF